MRSLRDKENLFVYGISEAEEKDVKKRSDLRNVFSNFQASLTLMSAFYYHKYFLNFLVPFLSQSLSQSYVPVSHSRFIAP